MSVRRGRAFIVGVALLVTVVAVAFVALRDGEEGASTTLLDGTPARAPPAVLAVGSEGVLVRARVLPAGAGGADAHSCRRLAGLEDRDRSPMLEVVGIHGRSLTFYAARRTSLAGCEASARAVEPRVGPWCGVAHGRLFDGRLRDGRLSMVNCRDEDGRTVAFGWIEPMARARWLIVRGDDALEVYPVVSRYPVRVTTKDVDTRTSSALFEVAQYGSDGRKLGGGRVAMRVAG